MTGFAAATSETEDLAVNVTLRSVNHRHLDV
ncbi:YicC/YloC family endoribonuclease, partial [Shinella sp.]